jgi:hypothetical protein
MASRRGRRQSVSSVWEHVFVCAQEAQHSQPV